MNRSIKWNGVSLTLFIVLTLAIFSVNSQAIQDLLLEQPQQIDLPTPKQSTPTRVPPITSTESSATKEPTETVSELLQAKEATVNALEGSSVAQKKNQDPIKTPKQKLALLNSRLSRMKSSVYSNKLQAFDTKVRMFYEGQMSMGSYVQLLTQGNDLTTKSNIEHPNVDLYLKATNLETNIDFKAVENERSRLIRRLAYHSGKTGLEQIRRNCLAYKMGHLSHSEFYSFLQKWAHQTGIKMTPYPNLKNYFYYVRYANQIDEQAFYDELAQLETLRFSELIVSPEQRRLAMESRELYQICNTVRFWEGRQSTDTVNN